jgi:hypothetical protein
VSAAAATAVNRADLLANAAITLAVIAEQHFDPAVRIICGIKPEGDISLQLYDAEIQDAARLADALNLTDKSSTRSENRATIHHYWDGAYGGFKVRVAYLEHLPTVQVPRAEAVLPPGYRAGRYSVPVEHTEECATSTHPCGDCSAARYEQAQGAAW